MASDKLSVFLHDTLVGYLWLDDTSRFSFQYDSIYLEKPEAIPLSLSLPMRETAYTNDTARPFFSNLLPEGEVRSLIAKIKQFPNSMMLNCLKQSEENAPVRSPLFQGR